MKGCEPADEVIDRCREFTELNGGEQRTGRGSSAMAIPGGVLPWSEAIKAANANEEAHIAERIRCRKLSGANVDKYTPLVRSGQIGHPGKTHFQQQKDRAR